MYKKGVAVEIQFSAERLNDSAGDPYWIDLTRDEAKALLHTLQAQLGSDETVGSALAPGVNGASGVAAPIVVSLDPSLSGCTDSAVVAADETPPAELKQWVCLICGWIYDEEAGLPEEGITPGTRWADVPEDWRCPLCDVGKADFALVEF